jgi:hypothetical protein
MRRVVQAVGIRGCGRSVSDTPGAIPPEGAIALLRVFEKVFIDFLEDEGFLDDNAG